METDSRPYPTIRADLIGKEVGVERFTKDGITAPPPAARWRNNLTALSQREHLFFIAANHLIYVYQPECPYRKLGRGPALIITPDLANPAARGYISHGAGGNEGHCINHVMVGDLGSQEILLLAIDSGNIVAYHISSIISVIQRSQNNPTTAPTSDTFGLRSFFSRWVYQSAWGLDIHKEGRMIAVSTNVPNEFQVGQNDDDDYAKIVVFAFALVETEANSDGDVMELSYDEWQTWKATGHTSPPKRDQSYIISLTGFRGHDYNIPNIQFVKDMDQSGGIWLMSTDIDGSMKMWQIWMANCVRSWDFNSNETIVRPWLHRDFPGWNVATLDPSIFRYAATKEEFTGKPAGKKLAPYYGFVGKGDSFDLSSTIARVPGNNIHHPLHADRHDQPYSTLQHQINHKFVSPISNQPLQSSIESPKAERPLSPSISREMTGIRSPEQPPQYTGIIEYDADSPPVDIEAGTDAEIEGPPELPPEPIRSPRRLRRVATTLDPSISVPDFAILHCSNTHIRLLGSPRQETPHILCHNILRQHMPENRITTRRGFEFLHMERLNMFHKLEHLGVVLIATQTGRVAICALTKRSDGLLGIRVDTIIPTSTQEHQGHRPVLCPLIGLAVAPVHTHPDEDSEPSDFSDGDQDGIHTTFETNMVVLNKPVTVQEKDMWKQQSIPPPIQYKSTSWRDISERLRDKPKRYLVMLTYGDLTVLTYEIWRD